MFSNLSASSMSPSRAFPLEILFDTSEYLWIEYVSSFQALVFSSVFLLSTLALVVFFALSICFWLDFNTVAKSFNPSDWATNSLMSDKNCCPEFPTLLRLLFNVRIALASFCKFSTFALEILNPSRIEEMFVNDEPLKPDKLSFSLDIVFVEFSSRFSKLKSILIGIFEICSIDSIMIFNSLSRDSRVAISSGIIKSTADFSLWNACVFLSISSIIRETVFLNSNNADFSFSISSKLLLKEVLELSSPWNTSFIGVSDKELNKSLLLKISCAVYKSSTVTPRDFAISSKSAKPLKHWVNAFAIFSISVLENFAIISSIALAVSFDCSSTDCSSFFTSIIGLASIEVFNASNLVWIYSCTCSLDSKNALSISSSSKLPISPAIEDIADDTKSFSETFPSKASLTT